MLNFWIKFDSGDCAEMKTAMKFFSILAFILICLYPHAYAQQESIRIIKKYNIKEGLSQAVVNSITQDENGLMWFATDDGLNRFDGYSFETYKFSTDSATHPHDNFVQHVFKDSEGTLWVSSRRGLFRLDRSTRQFIQYFYKALPTHNDVSYIEEGEDGNLWVAWYWAGLSSFDKENEKYTCYNQDSLSSLTSTATIVVHEDSYGLLWVGSQDKGLNVFKTRDGKIQDRRDNLSADSILPSLYVKSIEEDHLGNIWIGTTKGLALYLREQNRFHIFNDPRSMTNGKGVFSLHADSNKKLWVGTQGGGLYTLNLKDFDGRHVEKLYTHHVDVLDRYDISQHTIRSIFEDRDGNIWIGTHGDGIYMIGSEEKKFTKIQSKKFLKSAESYVSFYGLCNDEDGFIWVGTDGEGIYKLRDDGEIVRHYTADGKPGSITDDVVVTAYRDHQDNLWFGTYLNGLFLYQKNTDSFIHFPHAPSDAPAPLGNQVRLVFEDSRKNIWVGATRGGLCVVDRDENVFRYAPGNPILKTIDVRAIEEDKDGGLWIGCYGNGLGYYVPETGQWKDYFKGLDSGPELKSNVIFAMSLDRKNRLWIGTGGGGLSVYNTDKKTFKTYTDQDGLINNTIYSLLIDEAGDIWMSTVKGISKFDPDNEQFYNYTSIDGLQEGQFNPGSGLYNLQKGYMCFGGALGLNLFNPLKALGHSKVPDVMISGFRLFNKPVAVGSHEGEEILSKVIEETEVIELKHDQSVITFEFTALNYCYPEKNKYAYKLQGLDRDWNFVGNQRAATYRYLPAGNYEFKVKATSQDNTWPATYTSVRLVIHPPFWKTGWAYAFYLLIVVSVCYMVVMVRRRQDFLRRRLKIEKAQRKRERQLVREKLSFFTEVSHEFRTPLTLMIGPLEEILTREGIYTPIGKKLKLVYKNAHKLLNLINKLLDYRKVETGNMLLRVREDDIVRFVEEIFITFKELAIRKNIGFEFHAAQPSITTWFDREKLEMVLNNVLSNSFKYIGKGNAISITVKKQDEAGASDNVLIEVRDNGIGIPKDKLRYIFDWFYQGSMAHPVSTGIGLALARKLVHLHKGQIYVDSTEGKGSVFIIKIPIGKEHLEPHEIVIDEGNENLLHAANPSLLDDEPDAVDNTHKKGLKSVLIVEDEDEVRSFLRQYFENEYRVYESSHGKEGLETACTHSPDLIISDIMMPEMNGIDFCKQLKKNIKTSHIPVVLLTARTSFSHHKEGLEIGADAYVTKPFSPEMLALTINNLLQSREKLRRFYRSSFIHDETKGNGSEKKELVSPDEKLLQRVYDLVKMNLDKPEFNLDSVCEDLTMSRSLLYKKIKVLTGLSPVEYIRSLRMSEAARLLKTQQYKVFEVVYMVGFSDLKYFRQCFIKEFGYPPSQLIEK